jgi:hypothetical protein
MLLWTIAKLAAASSDSKGKSETMEEAEGSCRVLKKLCYISLIVVVVVVVVVVVGTGAEGDLGFGLFDGDYAPPAPRARFASLMFASRVCFRRETSRLCVRVTSGGTQSSSVAPAAAPGAQFDCAVVVVVPRSRSMTHGVSPSLLASTVVHVAAAAGCSAFFAFNVGSRLLFVTLFGFSIQRNQSRANTRKRKRKKVFCVRSPCFSVFCFCLFVFLFFVWLMTIDFARRMNATDESDMGFDLFGDDMPAPPRPPPIT